ncbi:MAG: flotillin family protein, partial [Myxococcota bacterium]
MPELLIALACVGATLVFIVIGVLVMIARFYRKVDQGKALIINKMKNEPDVTFTGGTVLPIIHRAELMDISVKTLEIGRAGSDGLICKDNIRADIRVAFYVRVNKTKDDVLKVAQAIGCQRASNQDTLEELFVAKFSEALKSVGKQMEFEELYTDRETFRDRIIESIGTDLNGYVLEDAAIDYLEQTPKKDLDPSNILVSQGIRKITEIT